MTDEQDHPEQQTPRYTREEWARARAEGRLYPDSEPGEWQKLSDITAKLFAKLQAAA